VKAVIKAASTELDAEGKEVKHVSPHRDSCGDSH
jgi:hypothetical protein